MHTCVFNRPSRAKSVGLLQCTKTTNKPLGRIIKKQCYYSAINTGTVVTDVYYSGVFSNRCK